MPPTVSSAATNTAGSQITLTWSEAVNRMVGATITVSMTARGATQTGTYLSGTGTAAIIYTLASTVYVNEPLTVAGAASIVHGVVSDVDNAAFIGTTVTNGSTAAIGVACTGAASGMMTNTCMVLRKTESQSSSSGGLSHSWAVVATGVCCSIQANGASENARTAKEEDAASYSGFFSTSLDLRNSDRVCLVTGAGIVGLSGKILEVVGRPVDHAGRAAYLFAPLEEVKGNG